MIVKPLGLASLLPLCVLFCCGAQLISADSSGIDASNYTAEIDAWHARRVEHLQRDDGWLTLVGLFPLPEGDSSIGTASSCELRLPENDLGTLGVIHRKGDRFRFTPSQGSELQCEGKPLNREIELHSDDSGSPTIVVRGGVSFYLIKRGEEYFVRAKDRDSEVRQSFHGIDRFPVDPAWRIRATWEPYDPPKVLETPNVLGQIDEEPLYGAIVFSWKGKTVRLHASGKPSDSLFLVFGDATNQISTYGGGRFLSIDPPTEDGTVVVDFNKAYDPPCVFTTHATCPLPPEGNTLPFAVEAGEKMWGEAGPAGP
jgi:hypothetical protein